MVSFAPKIFKSNMSMKHLLFLCVSLSTMASASVQTDIVLFGDSLINGSERLARPLVRQLQNDWNISGAGLCTFVDGSGTADIGMVYLRPYISDWVEVDQLDSAIGLNISHLVGIANGASLSFRVNSKTEEIEIYYLQQPQGGSFRVYANHEALGVISTDSVSVATKVYRHRWTPASYPATLDIVVEQAGGAGVKLTGVNFKTGDSGVRVHKIGNSGLTSSQAVAVNRAIWVDALRELEPEFFCVLLGANDHVRQQLPAQYKANIMELVDRAREAVPGLEVLLMSPPDNDYKDGEYALNEFRDVLIEICREQGLKFLDFKEVLGDFETANTRGWYADRVHPNDAGGELMADGWTNLIVDNGVSEFELVDLLDKTAVLQFAEFSVESIRPQSISLRWRHLPGIRYLLTKTHDFREWSNPSFQNVGNGFAEVITGSDELGFYSLELSSPELWQP